MRGEAVVTLSGLEGGAVYALSALLREAIRAKGEATLEIDLKPGHQRRGAVAKVAAAAWRAVAFRHSCARPPDLSPVAIALLREAGPARQTAERWPMRSRTSAFASTRRADRARDLKRRRRCVARGR